MHTFDDPIKGWITVLNILTNDDWWGVYELGLEFQFTATFIYIISMIFIVNYMTFGFVFAFLLEGFTKLKVSEEKEENSDEDLEAELGLATMKNKENDEDDEEIKFSEGNSLNITV